MNNLALPMDATAAAESMIAAGQLFHARGWVPATGGNFSVRVSAEHILITASGVHKGELGPEDFLLADLQGRPLQAGRKTSYETGLHTQLYRHSAAIGAVLHVHSVANTVLSRRLAEVFLKGYELQKILPEAESGNPQPESTVKVPVFGNDQNIERLSEQVDAYMRENPGTPGYLIAGHGLYAWGKNVAQARHRVEALELMFECELWSQGRD